MPKPHPSFLRMISLQQRLIESYTSQPSKLTEEIRERLPGIWGDQDLVLYAMADLNSEQRLSEDWILLGTRDLCILQTNGPAETRCILPRSKIGKIRETPNLSGFRWQILSREEPGEVLAEVRFSRRQQPCMENIRLMLNAEQEVQADPELADRAYSESLSEPIRSAQAAVRGDQLAVIWRLLGYLKPYQR
ncbi:MAG: hypothetical protein ACO3N7_11740, partial [Kiritimatiellia bacterium]